MNPESEVASINKTRKILANNIVYWRLKRNWSQEEFAYRLGSSTQYVSTMENGKRNISSDYIDHLATVLEIEPHELLVARPIVKNRRIDGK